MKSQRVLGIDYGSKRIGLAVSDPLRIIATAFRTIANDVQVWSTLRAVIEEQDIEFVVVGMPVTLKGLKGTKAEEVDRFVSAMKEHLGVEIVTWDERFTTSLAYQARREGGMKKKDRRNSRKSIDASAAAIMLQGFLDSTKKSLIC